MKKRNPEPTTWVGRHNATLAEKKLSVGRTTLTKEAAKLADSIEACDNPIEVIYLICQAIKMSTTQTYRPTKYHSRTGTAIEFAWKKEEPSEKIIRIMLHAGDASIGLGYHSIEMKPKVEKYFRKLYDSFKAYVIPRDPFCVITQYFGSWNGQPHVHLGIQINTLNPLP